MATIFLSYSRGDSTVVRRIHDGLEHEGYTALWDQENRPGEYWTEQVMAWLRDSDVVVVVVSPHSIGSYSVQSEIQIAIADFAKRVIPLQIAPKSELLGQPRTGLWLQVRMLQRIDAWAPLDPFEELYKGLWREGVRPAAAQNTPLALLQMDPDALNDPTDFDGSSGSMGSIPQGQPPPVPSQRRARLILDLPGTLAEFDLHEQHGFVQFLARLAAIDPGLIQIISVEAGSIRVTLELPEATARWLVESQRRNDEVAQLLSIQAIRDFTLITAPSPTRAASSLFDRLRTWFAGIAMPQRLIGAGALIAVVLILLVGLPLLNRAPSTNSIALCENLTLAAGRCASGSSSAFFTGEQASTVLGDEDKQVPRLITPRSSDLLTLTPMVRWTALPDTQSYTVTLQQGSAAIWSTLVVGANELAYPPQGAPTLERGNTYTFVIEAADGRRDTTPGTRFVVLNAEQAAKIEAEVERFQGRGLDAATTNLLIANLYANNGLYAEALELLEGTNTPFSALLQGNLYVVIDLPDLALEPFERAVSEAAQRNDRLGAALAHTRLGEIYTIENDLDRARTNYMQAIAIYRELGDAQRAEELTERLEVLSLE
jgi:hypothetical protein